MSTAVEVAVAFLEGFRDHDLDAAARFVAEDIVFESPRGTIHGRDAVLAEIGEFSQVVEGLDIIGVFGDDERALVMYDLKTGPFGTLRAADHFVVRDGKIVQDLLVFDTYELRKAAGQ